jgi:hypothetical protein
VVEFGIKRTWGVEMDAIKHQKAVPFLKLCFEVCAVKPGTVQWLHVTVSEAANDMYNAGAQEERVATTRSRAS